MESKRDRKEKRGREKREKTPEECTLRGRKGQYEDKVERITYRIASVHTEKENGKCHVAGGGSRARARALLGRTRGKGRKIRERAFTCVENLERYRGRGSGYTEAGRTPGNKYNKGNDDAEWTKSDVSVE